MTIIILILVLILITFVNRGRLEDLFPVMICMEDGPPKPHPGPVLAALKQLNVSAHEAIMLGDTVDDIVAAVRASVPVFGVMTPSAYATSVLAYTEAPIVAKLLAAGASRVLRPGCDELLDVIIILPHEHDEETNKKSHVLSTNVESSSLLPRRRRQACVHRATKETSIDVDVTLDGHGTFQV
jgi:hypothetical protein